MEGWEDNGRGGGKGVRDAALDVPLPGRNLRKSHILIKVSGLQKRVRFGGDKKFVINASKYRNLSDFMLNLAHKAEEA